MCSGSHYQARRGCSHLLTNATVQVQIVIYATAPCFLTWSCLRQMLMLTCPESLVFRCLCKCLLHSDAVSEFASGHIKDIKGPGKPLFSNLVFPQMCWETSSVTLQMDCVENWRLSSTICHMNVTDYLTPKTTPPCFPICILIGIYSQTAEERVAKSI